MNRNGGKVLVATLLVAIVLISGFSVLGQGSTVKPNASTGTLYIAMQEDMPNFNYFDIPSNTVWKTDVIGWNWDSLFGVDYDGSAIPWLVQNYTVNTSNPSQPVVTLQIRQGVYFVYPINGTPAYELTAKDVIFSYCAERYGTTFSGSAFTIPFDDNNDGIVEYNEIVNHVKYINNFTVQISMRQVYAQFFLDTLGIPIIPWKIWANHLKPDGVPGDNQSTMVTAEGYTAGVIDTTWNSDPMATMGSSIYYYAGGVPGSYRIEKLNTYFWGKNFVTPTGYHIYPQNVTQLYFKIYTTLDTAVLALESGDVDYIAWSIPFGYVPTLASDPQVSLWKNPELGYFYLAFNEAQQPMNDINFRHAISYLIDKNTIVQDYMGGLGQAGDSPIPPFFTAWYNSSVVKYPFDPSTASLILNQSGYAIGPDGWRLLPDGTPMPPITILTPPADYDPIRVKVGEALASEMRSIGIQASAKAINFDALVAQMSAFNYQMLTLGWQLSVDPLGDLYDIYGINALQNTWAFWPSNYTNPNYPNVKSLADNETGQLALQFMNVMNKAMTTFDVSKQIYYDKWAQGILTEAVPCNVLYYSINVEATLNIWQGWLSWEGSVYNIYSLASLHKGAVSGVGGVTTTQQTVGKIVYPPVSHSLVAQIAAPSKVFVPQPQFNVPSSLTTVPVSVIVTDNNGLPVPNAFVNLTSTSSNVTVVQSTGITNSAGIFTTSVSGNSPGYATLIANVNYDGMSVTTNTVIDSVQYVPNMLYINAYASEPSLMGGQSTTINIKVVDQYGNPVPGVNVSVATNLLGYGTITPTYVFTDQNGTAYMTFTAPSEQELATKYVNMHLTSKILLSASKPGYETATTESLIVATYNSNPSSWYTVHIIGATNYFVNQTSLTTTVTVQAVYANNTPIPNEVLTVTPSNESYIASISNTITNSAGYANVTITFKPGLPTAGIALKFWNSSYINSIGDSITIGYLNGPAPSNLYAGFVAFYDGVTGERTNFVTINGGSAGDKVVVHLFSANNQPASGSVPVGLIFSSTPEGSLLGFYDPNWTNPLSYYFDSLWEFVAINVNTTYMGFLPPTSGVFVSQLDNQIADPVLASWLGTTENITAFDYVYYGYGIYVNDSYVVNGTGNYYINGLISPMVDRISNVYVIPYAYTYYPQTPGIYPPGVIVNGNFYMEGSEYIASQLAIQRAPDYRIATFTVNSPFGFAGTSITVNATLYNSTDQPVKNTSVWFYSKTGMSPRMVNGTTNANGTTSVALPLVETSSLTVADLYVYWNQGQSVWGTAAITQSTQIVVVPYQANVFATASSYSLAYGQTAMVNVKVVDANGNPIPGIALSASASTGSISGPATTGPDGTATFIVTPTSSVVTGSPYIIDTVSIKASGSGYYGGVYNLVIIAYSSSPTVTVTNIVPSQIITASSYTVNGTVWDPAGIKSVVLYLDTPGNQYNVTLTPGANGVYTFSVPVSNFYNGLNAVFVVATNNNNVTTMLPVFFYYQPSVSYVTSQYFNSTLSSKLANLTMQTNQTLSGYYTAGMGNTALAIAIIAFILSIVALALSFRKPKQPKTTVTTPEEKKEEQKQ